MRVSDLLPTRWGAYLFLFLFGIGCVTGLLYACWTLPDREIFDPTRPGNLAAWFSAMLWFLASLICVTIFRLDRHARSRRLSDIWLWTVFGCLLLSADCACQVRDALRVVLVKLSGTTLYGNGDVWWIAVYLILFGMIGSRLLVEMRHHLLSCNTFFVAALSHILACCLALHLFDFSGQETRLPVLLRAGLEMLGAFFAVFSFSLFMRNMVLQIDFGSQIMVTPKTVKTKTEIKVKPPKTVNVVVEPTAKKEKQKEKEKPVDVKPEVKSKPADPSRTCPIVFPSQGGEKIVKVKAIDPLDDEETLERLKKARTKKSPQPQVPVEEEIGESDEFIEDEYDDAMLEDDEAAEYEEYEEYEEEEYEEDE